MFKDYYFKKNVLITGHTGFKGSWLCCMLKGLGANVYGYSLGPPTDPSLYAIAGIDEDVVSETGNIEDHDRLLLFMDDVKPDVVIHMAAQPLVRAGYEDPRGTYNTNVMGTVNILDATRECSSVRSFLNVTTDKVYDNTGTDKAYVETDPLNGFDPYSNSKSCSELVTDSYKKSFFADGRCAISTARAGNVIGGGDFAKDRILPDCIRAATSGNKISIRNPNSTRPYQHVLEPLYAYLVIAAEQGLDPRRSGNYNVGPVKTDAVTTGHLATLFCKFWGENIEWESVVTDGPHEANYLSLDSTLIKDRFGIVPRWNIEEAVKKTVDWTRAWISGRDVRACIDAQIQEYFGCG